MSAIIIGGSWKKDLERKLAAASLARAFDVAASLADYAVGITIDRNGSHRLDAPELNDRLVVNLLPTCFIGETEASTFEQNETSAAHWLVLATLDRPPINSLAIESGQIYPADLTAGLGQTSGFAVDGVVLMDSGFSRILPCRATAGRFGRILNGILLPPMPTDMLDCHDDHLARIAQLIFRNHEVGS